MSAVRVWLKVDKPGHERGSGTGREWDSATLNTESSSRPGNRTDRARVPVVDLETAKLIQAGVSFAAYSHSLIAMLIVTREICFGENLVGNRLSK